MYRIAPNTPRISRVALLPKPGCLSQMTRALRASYWSLDLHAILITSESGWAPSRSRSGFSVIPRPHSPLEDQDHTSLDEKGSAYTDLILKLDYPRCEFAL
jgi:hypothetical protein